MSKSPTNQRAELPRASKAPAILLISTLLCLALTIVSGALMGASAASLLGIVTFVLFVSTLVVASRQGRALEAGQSPIAYSTEGHPIYPVVGYTADGNAVTADRVGVRADNDARTNSLAVVALVLGIVLPPLAIPVAQVARDQIKRTGEKGAGIALAGLVLGWLSVVAIALAIIAVVS